MKEAPLRQRPTCGKCNRLVDKLTEEFDDFLLRVVFRAHCHGEVERVDVDAGAFDVEAGAISGFGVAFRQLPQLTSGGLR